MIRLKNFHVELENCAFVYLPKQKCIAVLGNYIADDEFDLEENVLIYYDIKTLRQIRRIVFYDESASGLYYSPKYDFIARYAHKELSIMDPKNPSRVRGTLTHDHTVAECCIEDSKDIICTADEVEYVYLWHSVKHIQLKKIRLLQHRLMASSYWLNYMPNLDLILTMQDAHIEIVNVNCKKIIYEYDIPIKESLVSAQYYLSKTGEMLWIYQKAKKIQFLKYAMNAVGEDDINFKLTDEVEVPFFIDAETLEFDAKHIIWGTVPDVDRIFRMDPYTFEFEFLEIQKYKKSPAYDCSDSLLFEIGKFVFLFEHEAFKVHLLEEQCQSNSEGKRGNAECLMEFSH